MKNEDIQETGCCPRFNPEPWENKMIVWEKKKFIRMRVRTFFFMPLNFGPVIRKADELIKASGATVQDNLCLSDHTSKWNMNILLAVDREVQGAENIELTGNYFSRVYEGPFRDTDKWCKDYSAVVKGKGMTIKKWYMWYTTCPKCAKKYGKNFVVIINEVTTT